MNLLALDLSSRCVGYAFGITGASVYAGSTKIDAGGTPEERIPAVGEAVAGVLLLAMRVGPPIDRVVIEVPNIGKGQQGYMTSYRGILMLGMAAGAALVVLRQGNYAVDLWDAQRVRERLCGQRTATKADVQWVLEHGRGLSLPTRKARFGEEIDHDAADAMALWVAWNDEEAEAERLGIRREAGAWASIG